MDYGVLQDLVSLGQVSIETGETPLARSAFGWPGPWAAIQWDETGWHETTIRDWLARESQRGAEGVVLRTMDGKRQVKAKYEDYVRLHRIVTGTTEKTIWEALLGGTPRSEILDGLPDEFYKWAERVVDELLDTQSRMLDRAWRDFHLAFALSNTGDDPATRADFARAVSSIIDAQYRPAMYFIYDRNFEALDKWALKQVKPDSRKEAQTNA